MQGARETARARGFRGLGFKGCFMFLSTPFRPATVRVLILGVSSLGVQALDMNMPQRVQVPKYGSQVPYTGHGFRSLK